MQPITAIPITTRRFAAAFGLVAIADFLIFGYQPGLNLFIFAAFLSLTLILLGRRRYPLVNEALLFVFCLLASVPLLQEATGLAIITSLVGLTSTALIKAGLSPRQWIEFPFLLFRFVAGLPWRTIQACMPRPKSRANPVLTSRLRQTVRLWLLPVGFTSVFLLLFLSANPLFEIILKEIRFDVLLRFLEIGRILFCLLIFSLACAFMWPRLLNRRKPKTMTKVTHSSGLLMRCLVLFNLLFAVQTILDCIYLWGGVALPEGMTYAQYAHRGAYSLLVTALLAAGFVLVALRPGGPDENNRLARILVTLWISQNIFLCISSILRLDLYVDTYALTHMRLNAAVWMGLVAVGLGLISLRIHLRRSNTWLIAYSTLTLALTIYGYTLVDRSGFIARFNVAHCVERSGKNCKLDIGHMYELGPSAIPALDRYISILPPDALDTIDTARAFRQDLLDDFHRNSSGWRSWTWQRQRLNTYLATTAPFAQDEHMRKQDK